MKKSIKFMETSLNKLKSIAHFLKGSSRYNFQNYNLTIFLDFLKNDPNISIIISNLLKKHSDLRKDVKEVSQNRKQPGGFGNFEDLVAFCVFYIEEVGPNGGNKTIDNFIVQTQGKEDDEGLTPKNQFYNECIEPIIIYVELQITNTLIVLRILERYKVLCEWHDIKTLRGKEEKEITQDHLSKFLFQSGFTYCLSETNVPSGRIDNFIPKPEELSGLSDVIVAESKIFKGKKKDIIDCKNQVQKRLEELNLMEGYCVIFNKEKKDIKIHSDGNIKNFYYLSLKNKKIYFLVVNLNEIFYQSKAKIEEVNIDLKK